MRSWKHACMHACKPAGDGPETPPTAPPTAPGQPETRKGASKGSRALPLPPTRIAVPPSLLQSSSASFGRSMPIAPSPMCSLLCTYRAHVMYYSRRNTTRVYATRARKPRTLTSPRRVGGSPAATAKRRRNKPHQQVPTQPWG